MKSVLIIGYGNPLCGDDGVGPAAIEALEPLFAGDASVSLQACHQLTPELVDHMVGKDMVIFIDATLEGRPGEVRECKVDQEAEASTLSHVCTPTSLLVAARILFGSHVRGIVYTIGGENFALGESLSASVRSALPELVERVREEVAGRPASARVLDH